MARGRNEIFVEWLESKEKANQVNVKQKIGDLGEVEKDSAVTVRFNSRRYQARVVDLSDWKPPKQCRKKCSSADKKSNMMDGDARSSFHTPKSATVFTSSHKTTISSLR